MESTWTFLNDDGLLGNIKFNKGGSISVYDSEHERFWSFDGMFLTVMNWKKQPNVKYVDARRDFYGKWHLQGMYIGNQGWRHYLVQQ